MQADDVSVNIHLLNESQYIYIYIYIYMSLTISFFHLDLSLFLVYTNHNLQIRGTIIFVVRMYLC